MDKGHGRLEQRRLTASTELNGYLDWPGVGQIIRVVRERTMDGHRKRDVAYAITSLPPQRASPERLLSLIRSHWGIENSLHYVRDVTYGEDASRVRDANSQHALAACRNVAITLCAAAGVRNHAAAARRFAAHAHEAAELLGLGRIE